MVLVWGKKEVTESVIFTPLATLPTSPDEGVLVYDNSDNKMKYWDGTSWVIIESG